MAKEFEITDRHSARITVLGRGTFEEFTARLEQILPVSTPAEIVQDARTRDDVLTKIRTKAPLWLLYTGRGLCTRCWLWQVIRESAVLI